MHSAPAAIPGGDEAREIQHAIDMLVELIPDAHDCSYPDRVQRACRESFAMNARVLIDFLTTANRRDICADDFAERTWSRPRRAGDVNRAWRWASENVAHLSKQRLSYSSYDVTEHRMQEIARLVVGLLDDWVAEVEAASNPHPDAAALRSSVARAQALL